MPKLFSKTKRCGCVVTAMVCGIKNTEKGKIYLLGCHEHIKICSKCELDEENQVDTLYGMWHDDNTTDDLGNGGWIEYEKNGKNFCS